MRLRLGVGARVAMGGAGLLLAAGPWLGASPPAHAAPPAAAPGLVAAAPAAAAAPGSGLGGFKLDSESSGIAMTYNDGSEVNFTVPDAETDFSTGAGHALSADLYPGPIGGNPGATIQQFLGADLPASIIQPLSTLQDNYKAEAYASGPNDASFPAGGPNQALYDSAHADPSSATAIGTLENGGENVTAKSVTQIVASSVTTTATSTVSDVSIAGVIHIGQVVSTATASSDGTTGKATATTTVSGITVAGQAVSVGPKGLTVGPSSLPLNLSSAVNAAVQSLGITMSLSPNDKVTKGSQASDHAPALSIFLNPPQNQGNTVTITLGGADAEANASAAYVAPPVTSAPPTATVAPVAAVGGGTASDFSGGGGSTDVATPLDTGGTPSAFAAPVTSAPAASALPHTYAFTPASTDFSGIKWGLVVLGMLAVGGAAFGMGKVPTEVLDDKSGSSPCPLERSTS